MNILADASLPGLEQAFPKPFHLTYYHNPEEINDLLIGQDALLCRSTLKINKSLLGVHHLRYVATASSGIDHLDIQWLSSQNIQVIDAKGCNARSVADYVIACIAYLKQKDLIKGNKAGIIGMGNVGTQVSARLKAANFQIKTYDPPKAEHDHSFHSCFLEELYPVDLLCIHAELHDMPPYPSANLINKDVFEQLKPGCVLINAARGGIINEHDLLQSGSLLTYCTDVYLNEPTIEHQIIDKATLCTPHIAGHSLEAKYAAVALVSHKLHQCAGYPLPQITIPLLSLPSLSVHEGTSWHQSLLDIYNPLEETIQLKKASNKTKAFLDVRKKHQKRHDFCHYFKAQDLDSTLKLLLGMFADI